MRAVRRRIAGRFVTCRALRDLGPAVHLPHYDLRAIPRYHDLRDVLHNREVFSSARGVSIDPMINQVGGGGTLQAIVRSIMNGGPSSGARSGSNWVDHRV